MASPFSIFRKHQRVLMVVLVIMAMFAFTLSDLFSMTDSNLPLLCLMLGAGILAAFGWARGKVVEYAVIGAVAGLLIGFVGPMFAGSNAVVKTKAGDFSEEQLQELVARRSVANQFVQAYWNAAERKVQLKQFLKDNPEKNEKDFDNQFRGTSVPPGFRFTFGRQFDQDVVLGVLLRKEAEKYGVKVGDDGVNAMIREISQRAGAGLSAEEFEDVRRRVQYKGGRVTESDLFEILKEELTAKLTIRLLMPGIPPTPDRYWQMYQKLKVEQELEVVRVPVKPFAELEADPSDAELQVFFDQWKSVVPNQENGGDPGFLQPPRVALAYLEVDFLATEKLVPEITEEQISEFYESKKEERYKNFIPEEEGGSSSSTTSGKPESDSAAGEQPAGTGLVSPDLPNPNQPANPEGDPKSPEESSAPKPEGAVSEPPSGESTPDSPPKSEPGSEDQPCGQPPETPAVPETPAAEEKPAAETGTNEPQKEAPAGAAADQAAADKADAPAAGQDDPAEPAKTDDSAAQPPASNEPPPYRPLDSVRDAIRDELLQGATRALVAEKVAVVLAEMRTLSRDYYTLNPDDETRGINPEQIKEKLEAIADADPAIRYVETKRLSYRDLTENDDYKDVGQATDPNASGVDAATVAEELFSTENRLYTMRQAETLAGNQFVYWVIQQVPAHVPESLDEVRDQVVEAWKMEKAKEQAAKRADEIKALVTKALAAGEQFESALEGKTLTGKEDGQSLSELYAYTQPFSWLRQSAAPGLSFNRPVELSRISGVEGADAAFMEYVFEELGEGDVGVRPGFDKTEYFVVQVRNRRVVVGQQREPMDGDSMKRLQQQFLGDLQLVGSPFFQFSSPLPQLVQNDQQQLMYNWSLELEKAYDVDWTGIAAE